MNYINVFMKNLLHNMVISGTKIHIRILKNIYIANWITKYKSRLMISQTKNYKHTILKTYYNTLLDKIILLLHLAIIKRN